MRKTAFTERGLDEERGEIEGERVRKRESSPGVQGYLLNERARLLGDEIPLSRWFISPRLRYIAAFLYTCTAAPCYSYPRLDLLFTETRQIRLSAAFVPETRVCPL